MAPAKRYTDVIVLIIMEFKMKKEEEKRQYKEPETLLV